MAAIAVLVVTLYAALASAPARVASAAAASAAARTADSTRARAPADTAFSPRIVRRLPTLLVPGERRPDFGSIETVRALPSEFARALPVDDFASLVATRAGVVAAGGDLHVRGGRAGELSLEWAGLALNDPLTGRPPDVPLGAIEGGELLLGGLEAEHGGTLAGVFDVRPRLAPERWQGASSWSSDGRRGTGFDAVRAEAGGPLPGTPLAVAVAGDATLDDLGLPALRSRGRSALAGRSFGWRNDNRLVAWGALVPRLAPRSASVQVLASRRIEQPYEAMFTFDGWVHPCPDSQSCYDPFTHTFGFDDSTRYRAADHTVMTETRSLAAIATLTKTLVHGWWRVSLGLARRRALTSVGLRSDDGYIRQGNRATFGSQASPRSDPFFAYGGDEPYFRRSIGTRWQARSDVAHTWAPGARTQAGVLATYDDVSEYEHDDAEPRILGVDLVRSYRAFAPGGAAYAQHRWEYNGLVLNAGLRLQWFSAGPQAAPRPQDVLSLSPRLGFAYPMSDRDAFALSYVRLHQDPPRRYLYESRTTAYARRPLGNPDLRPAEVLSYQAAFQHLFDESRTLQVAIFHRDVYGMVGARDTTVAGAITRPRYQDDDVAHAFGVETTLLWRNRRLTAELSYTWLEAWGLQSSEDGLTFRPALGRSTEALGEHPLDWDQRHTFTLSAVANPKPWLSASWSTRVGSPRPWTPNDGFITAFENQLPQPFDPARLNSARLGWTETSDLSLRARWPGARTVAIALDARNVFGTRFEERASLSGFPNVRINTLYDEYGAYRTLTGQGGGAYWDDPNGTGQWQWIPVHDPRLMNAPRSLRAGIEVSF